VVGKAPELLKDVAAATGPKKLDQVYAADDGFVVAQLTDRKHPNEQDLGTQKEKVRDEVVQARRNEAIEAYRKTLRKQAAIKVNAGLAGGGAPKAEQS
jgi:hypothetical protein